ncbi:antitermination protein NusB [Catenovulum adriaticum]|uniref:Antitermination protein NusB n=1 Tax=Catenovulum adriaticum TaxID=2984846 RepID=A0ABY7ASE7_9ALTE|nr:antitermination protein NusB [Catenovulum sp. TS8]WAJ72463.1 antitermination protein NusB [Catenovulum sp. TS8]
METISSSGSYFVGWGTLALINAGLAQGKGRKGLNWFLISMLLGPIATFLLLVMEDLKSL